MSEDLITLATVVAYDPSRSNLFKNGRDFSSATGWANKASVTVTANAAAGADNLVLADKMAENAAVSAHYVDADDVTAASNVPYTVSLWAKAAGRTEMSIEFFSGAAFSQTLGAVYDLSAGTVASTFDFGTGTIHATGIENYGGGWFRCWITATPESGTTNITKVRLRLRNAGAASYLGDGTSGILLDRAMMEAGSALGDYIDTGATAGPGTVTLRYGTDKVITGSADTPPHAVFYKRIIEPPNFSRRAFGDARITSGGQSTGGELELANADQELAPLLDYGMDGRDITIYVGQEGAAFPGGWTVWLKGTIEQPEVGVEKVALQLRDRMAILDLPLQPLKFAGTNAAGSGAEGVATDLKGKPKPKCWGRCYHVPGVYVNTSKYIYQFNDGAVQAFDAVYDRGSPITIAANYANLALLEAAIIPANQCATCTALGLVRLQTYAVGKVTADVRGDASGAGYVDRVGAIVRRILETVCGVPTADIDTASFTALDAAANYEVGVWIGDETSRRAVIEMLQETVGAWFLPSRTGVWSAGRLVAPSGTAAVTLTNKQIVSIDRVSTSDPGKGVPIGEVSLRYKRYWAGFSEGDLVAPGGALSEATRNELLQDWRTTATVSNATTKAKHLLFSTLQRSALFTTAADADAERDRVLALFSVRRDFVRLRTGLTAATAALDIGSIVDVLTDMLGYDAGRKFVVLGVGLEGNMMDLDLWG